MVSRQDRMRRKCSQYLERDLRENVKFSQLLFENPFLGVIVTNDEQVYALGSLMSIYTVGTTGTDLFGVGPLTTTPKLSKIEVLCGKKIRQFAAGDKHILALSESGAVYTWGCNSYGQLGNNSKANSQKPIVVAGDLKERVIKQVECGTEYSVVLSEDGKVFTWGNNSYGRTGHGTDSGSTKSPKIVGGLLNDQNIVRIACQWASVFCLAQDGKVFGFGFNGGNLGAGDGRKYLLQPVQLMTNIPGGVCRFQDIICGKLHTLALSNDGRVFAWCNNDHGQLGTGDYVLRVSPVPVNSLDCKITKIMAEDHTSFAMDDAKNVYVWGKREGYNVAQPTKSEITFPEPFFESSATAPQKVVISDLLKGFDNRCLSDFVICVEGKDIHVHKAILQLRSPYFETMFSNEWKETENARVIIESHSYEVYHAFLRYIYCGELGDIGPEHSLRLMDLATMVLDDHLAALCQKRIKTSMTLDNLLKVYSVALLLEKEELSDDCVTMAVNKGIKEVVASDAFQEVPAEHARKFITECMLLGAFDVK